MRMMHDQLRTIAERYTPTMLDVVAAAAPEDIARLEAAAGTLPDSYRDFLGWMGARCPFLDGEQLAYSPADVLELVYDAEIDTPPGFLWLGVDKSGASVNVYLRRADDSVHRAAYYEELTDKDMQPENSSLASFLLTAYVRRTLAPSHPFNFTAAFKGDDEQVHELWHRVEEACSHFEIPYPVSYPEFRFYGGNDFVIGVHQRPKSRVVNFHFGAIERATYEPWYDLVFARWRSLRMPV